MEIRRSLHALMTRRHFAVGRIIRDNRTGVKLAAILGVTSSTSKVQVVPRVLLLRYHLLRIPHILDFQQEKRWELELLLLPDVLS
jgi:hypothetical protein